MRCFGRIEHIPSWKYVCLTDQVEYLIIKALPLCWAHWCVCVSRSLQSQCKHVSTCNIYVTTRIWFDREREKMGDITIRVSKYLERTKSMSGMSSNRRKFRNFQHEVSFRCCCCCSCYCCCCCCCCCYCGSVVIICG